MQADSGTGYVSDGSTYTANLGFKPTRVMVSIYSDTNNLMRIAFKDTTKGTDFMVVNGNGNALTITDTGFSFYVYAGYGRCNFYWLAVKD